MRSSWLDKYLSAEQLQAIADAIREAETTTAGEIRVSIHRRRRWKERKVPLHEAALMEFHRLGMHRTTGRTGILLFLLFGQRQFQIVADEGIHRKVAEGTWERLAAGVSDFFRQGRFHEGILHAVAETGAILARHVPRGDDTADQLPDEVHVE